MKITVNNNEQETDENATISNLLAQLSVPPKKTLVSINDETLSPETFNTTQLKENDSVDLFTFVAGG